MEMTSTVQVEALELVVSVLVSTLAHYHPGSIEAAAKAIQRANANTSNVIPLKGARNDARVIQYALAILSDGRAETEH